MFPAHKYQSVTEFIPYELLNHLECEVFWNPHTSFHVSFIYLFYSINIWSIQEMGVPFHLAFWKDKGWDHAINCSNSLLRSSSSSLALMVGTNCNGFKRRESQMQDKGDQGEVPNPNSLSNMQVICRSYAGRQAARPHFLHADKCSRKDRIYRLGWSYMTRTQRGEKNTEEQSHTVKSVL